MILQGAFFEPFRTEAEIAASIIALVAETIAKDIVSDETCVMCVRLGGVITFHPDSQIEVLDDGYRVYLPSQDVALYVTQKQPELFAAVRARLAYLAPHTTLGTAGAPS